MIHSTIADFILENLPRKLRFGQRYLQSQKLLTACDHLTRYTHENYQLTELQRLWEESTRYVPFYREFKYRTGLGKLTSIRDLASLPIVTKDLIRERWGSFASSKYSKRQVALATTGGSSGDPFQFLTRLDDGKAEWAFVHYLWSRVGFKPGDWRFVLRGAASDDPDHRRLWKRKGRYREVWLSSYDLSRKNIHDYFKVLTHEGPEFLHCYPSTGHLLAKLLQEAGLRLKLRAVLVSSETLFPFQKELMASVFSCPVQSIYGLSERATIASGCEISSDYHFVPQFGITEILDQHGNPVTEPGGVGEIVATSLLAKAMPFIRYRTGDMCVVGRQKCDCGRNHLLVEKILGRSCDYIVTRDMRLITLTGLLAGNHCSAFSAIYKMQIIQRTPGLIKIMIVKGTNYDSGHEHELRDCIRKCVDDLLGVEIEYVVDIPQTARGKHKFLVQHVPLNDLAGIAA